jgi:acetyl-CoA decarbonylase/synthase complex subunit epsilon
MGIVDLTNRLTDPEWGLDGKGPHDVVAFSGVQYPLLSQMLSTLKHFAPNLRTIALDRFFQPNADWSFPNLKEDEWEKEMLKVQEILSGSE